MNDNLKRFRNLRDAARKERAKQEAGKAERDEITRNLCAMFDDHFDNNPTIDEILDDIYCANNMDDVAELLLDAAELGYDADDPQVARAVDAAVANMRNGK